MNPSELHKKAEEARENDQHELAFKYIGEAISGYKKLHDYPGLSKAYQSRVLIYKHLFLLTNNKSYVEMAKDDAEDSLQIAKEHNLNEALPSCYFRLGEISMLIDDFGKAAEYYQKSLDIYVGSSAEKGDFTYHLGEAVWKKGEKARGKELMLEGLSIIQENRLEVDPFLIHVWESGAYMRLAECLLEENIEEAREYLEKGQKIVDSDEKLVIRRRQYEKLAKKFI